jgi:luciferase family oxidoreductase group 1
MTGRKLSFLDFGYYRPPEVQAVHTINNVFDLVGKLERAGYHRYWMAEHYNDYCSWTNPEIMISVLAGSTDTIRIGAAGILLHYHSSYRVAAAFKMLSALYPHRIDLGIARGSAPPEAVYPMLYKKELDREIAGRQVNEIGRIIRGEFNEGDPLASLPLPPYGTALPQLWLLGTSAGSAVQAVEEKMNFSISLFHDAKPLNAYTDAIKKYKDDYHARYGETPVCNIAVQCTCIEDDNRLKVLGEEFRIQPNDINALKLLGTPAFCADRLGFLYEAFGVDEIVVYEHNRVPEEKEESVLALGEIIIKQMQNA